MTVHGNVPGAIEVRSHEGDLEETLLGEKAKLEWHQRHDHRDVHVAGMVGYQHVASIGIDLFDSFGDHLDAADREQDPGPEAGNGVLAAAGGIEKRRDEGERSHHDRRNDNQRRRDAYGIDFAKHGSGGVIPSPF